MWVLYWVTISNQSSSSKLFSLSDISVALLEGIWIVSVIKGGISSSSAYGESDRKFFLGSFRKLDYNGSEFINSLLKMSSMFLMWSHFLEKSSLNLFMNLLHASCASSDIWPMGSNDDSTILRPCIIILCTVVDMKYHTYSFTNFRAVFPVYILNFSTLISKPHEISCNMTCNSLINFSSIPVIDAKISEFSKKVR